MFESCHTPLQKAHDRATVAYLGSANDVYPVHQHKDLDWVLLTPEPNHPVAISHWPPDCNGYKWFVEGGDAVFLDGVHACLGRLAWTRKCVGENEELFSNSETGQTVRLFYNQAVGDASDRARHVLRGVTRFVKYGWAPSKDAMVAIGELLPHGREEHTLCESDVGTFMPVDLNKSVCVGDEWVFRPHEHDEEESDGEEESEFCDTEEDDEGDEDGEDL